MKKVTTILFSSLLNGCSHSYTNYPSSVDLSGNLIKYVYAAIIVCFFSICILSEVICSGLFSNYKKLFILFVTTVILPQVALLTIFFVFK